MEEKGAALTQLENELFISSWDMARLCNSLAPDPRTIHFLAAAAGGTQEIKHPSALKQSLYVHGILRERAFHSENAISFE